MPPTAARARVDLEMIRLPLVFLSIGVILAAACAPVEATAIDGVRWERAFFTAARARDLVVLEDVVLYATTQGLFYSHDRQKFTRTGSDLPGSPEIIAIGAAKELDDLYAVTELGYLIRSSDRGLTFQTVGQFPHVRVAGMALTGGGRIFVASSSGLLMSNTDPSLLPGRQVRSYLMPWELLVLGLPIWRRANLAGDTDLWKEWDIVKEGTITRIAANPFQPEHLIIEILHEGALRTTDEGVTWTPLRTDDGETVSGPVAFSRDGRVLCGRFLSRDGGATWEKTSIAPDPDDLRQAFDQAFPVHSSAITAEGIWAVHYRAAAVYLMRNDGSWRRAGGPEDFQARDRETSPSLLAADEHGELWLATEGHGLYRRARVDK